MCRANEPVHKPDSVPFTAQPEPRLQRAVNIHLGQSLLTASSSYLQTRRAAFKRLHRHTSRCILMPCSRWGLPGQISHLTCRCALTAPFHPYHRLKADGGLLSVALSRGSLRVAVNNHHALWSPDFPRPTPGHPGRTSGSLDAITLTDSFATHNSTPAGEDPDNRGCWIF